MAALAAAILLTTTAPGSAQEAPRVGQTFGDWVFDCTALSETASRCQLKQTMVTPGEARRAVAQLTLMPGAEGQGPALSVLLPLGLIIPAGVSVAVDDDTPLAMTLLRCVAAGCVAQRALSAEDVAALRAGTVLKIRFANVPGRQITLDGSLKGVSAGLDATGWDS
ncbi:hypothetical protein CBW24_17855 (plasmid) [Pacificitalea manganoxidans]|jgi:invasion protein IalB|uniref:Invasion protein IalB n=2 Tax=Pacificitalea manganoxidans TaxID=1411902 RepID=A0A291M4U9_9RHOB|nr:hypothetical protein CBW24_17855 [Pacificitalea manganoxidans]OWU66842.1 hypothetical protein ATO2_17315 [Roseovarius sp. 22II1-1F6A]|tara:strand:+ start:1437 stop:1934 length:498 start_codon:yes stop_codon:yes gene_type:complete